MQKNGAEKEDGGLTCLDEQEVYEMIEMIMQKIMFS